ncbi:MAG TPA: Gfo/Idh/MocA family oxidoreductase [Sphingomonas sp.]|uniref:Gfo/Idh/MocA family protein n=1 Tax=Sphingomonas sp. TaxID=28214 RepID=UPI002B543C31|nr:Gfo/Idh/MocA family oxidoreductase [Sphingomonas sp.]HMI19220.1 Gfo/Idh/MocA family oxidoreductase [Sphingomonas sp.]
MAEIRIGIIGFGKIAQDQHALALAGDPDFRLAAVVAPEGAPDSGVPTFADAAAMLRSIELDAVAICTPPGPRHGLARDCLEAGLHVLLEKPPCATLGEVADLAALAERKQRSLFTAWHSQFNDTVAKAAGITRREGIAGMDIQWLEDVEKWHPGQDWIWQRGGFGVFDPGINALSIACLLCPEPLLVRAAQLHMHEGGQQPVAVDLALETGGMCERLGARFDFRHTHGERWTIDLITNRGTRIALSEGGAVLRVDDGAAERTRGREYPDIYRRFAALIGSGDSEVDAEPLRIVADALLSGVRLDVTRG